jgi:hypothetical protein
VDHSGVQSKLTSIFRDCALVRPHVVPAFHLSHQTASHDFRSYARNGVFSGVAPLFDPSVNDIMSVGVVCCTWPSWVYPFSHQSFKLLWIIVLPSGAHLFEAIKNQFQHVSVIQHVEDEGFSPPGVADIICFNGPCVGLSIAPTFGLLAFFDWKFRNRGKWDQWFFRFDSVSHSRCGGTSDFSGFITIGRHSSVTSAFPLHSSFVHSSFPACNLSTVTKCTITGKELLDDPHLPTLSGTPVTTSIGKNLFHFKGLFPFSTLSPEFLLPCVFGKRSKWVRRSLSLEEYRDVLDVPVSGMRKRSLFDLLPSVKVPIKILSAVVNDFFFHDTGGGVCGKFNDAYQVSNTNEVDSATMATPWISNIKEIKDEAAVKHDDAEVPLHFWFDALECKLKRTLNFKERHAIGILRDWSVNYIWKRSITKCFCCWLRCSSCHNKRLNRIFDKSFRNETLRYSCNDCKSLTKHDKDMLTFNHVLINGKWKIKYEWSDTGQKKYKHWHNRYMRTDKAIRKDIRRSVDAASDCITRAANASTWSWDDGSRPFFWRWGDDYWEESRDGTKIWIKDDLPNYSKKQKVSKEKHIRMKEQEKVQKVRGRRYIVKGKVISITSFFSVPKGKWDIRMVYNGTSCGLNDSVYAPWFALPTVDSHLRAVDIGTYMADCDIGEMFLNFMLDVNLRAYAGVDLTELFPVDANGNILWERWERMLMGFKPSPYCTTRSMRRIEEKLKGPRGEEENVFRWDRVEMNLPGSTSYDTSKPWVFKVRKDGTMASDLFIYIDDLRPTAPTKEECWDSAHQVCCRLTWFGIQDAPRKRREASQTPGAWAGTIIHTSNGMVTVLVSQDKWDKTKKWINWMSDVLSRGNEISHKELERCRGFLIYVSRTYKAFVPYLRGIHKTIDSWRGYRNEDGWKMTELEIRTAVEADEEFRVNEDAKEHGELVTAVPRLINDVNALKRLTKDDAPPKVVKRRKKSGSVCYGFGDASGQGFGNAIEVNGLSYSEYGTWNKEIESKHSNYKELRNLVNAIKNAYQGGLLKDAEIFLFTDNFVAECAFYNGGSNVNKELNELVFELWNLQMKGDFTLHVYHVAGTRMIESGIDGLSRGDKLEGVGLGKTLKTFVPIHLSAVERSSGILDWIETWWDKDEMGDLKYMKPIDWFADSMKGGNFFWDIAPAAGQVAVEQICTHVHGRPDTLHIIAIPRLCTSMWRKQLNKVADLIIQVQPKEDFWGKSQHEPLLIAFYFPILPTLRKYRPWQLKGTELVDRTRRKLQRMQETSESVDWSCLRELLFLSREVLTMPDGLARELLSVKREG